MRLFLKQVVLVATIFCFTLLLAESAFAQEEAASSGETGDSVQELDSAPQMDSQEFDETQFAAFLMQLVVLSQRFERTTPEMRTALTVINGMMLLGSTEEDVQGYLAETLDLLERTNLRNPIDSPLVPTGNGLLDAYLAEVERQVYAMQLDPEDFEAQVSAGGVPNEEFLAACEADYGTEPDYWELKYVAARAAGESEEQAINVFAEAGQAGCADGELLCNWLTVLRSIHISAAYKLRGKDRQETAFLYFTDEMYDEELAILDRAILLDPYNAWPYYQRALIYLLRGQDDEGLRDLIAGNVAPEYTPPLLFPMREIRESFTAEYPAGSAIADGAILVHYLDIDGLSRQLADGLLQSQVLKVLVPNHASPDDELVLEFWDYLVRTGQLKNLEFIDRAGLVSKARRLLEGIGGGDEFSELHHNLAVLSFGLYRAQRDVLHNSPDYFGSIITMTFAGGIPGIYAGYYAYEQANFNRDPETQAQVMADLAELDVRTMTPPPSWEKYREVGEKQLAEYEERRRLREQEQAEAEGAGAAPGEAAGC